jgi:hypothetical protein
MAVGETNSDRTPVGLRDRWNGRSWQLTGTHRHATLEVQFFAVSCPTTTMCLAVGSRNRSEAYAERFNGSTWTKAGTPAMRSDFRGVSCISGSTCFAVSGASVAQWSAGSWRAVASF